MNWSDLQHLRAFHHAESLQEAAAALGVNHTTVSRRIRELERELGCKLVEHVSGRLVLTEAGAHAVAVAERMAKDASGLELELMQWDERIEGELRVGVLDYTVQSHAELFTEFSRAYPDIRLLISSGMLSVHNLADREADVVIRVATQPRETLVGRKLSTLHFGVFASSSLLARTRETGEPMPFIAWDESARAVMTDRWMAEHLEPSQIKARVETPESMLALAKAGFGAMIFAAEYAAHHPELEQVGPILEGFETTVWILTHRDLARVARVKAFVDFVHERWS